MLILASASPRRKEILSFFNLPFEIVDSKFDERSVLFVSDPRGYVLEIAEKKAKNLDKKYYNDIIISADTIVHADKKIYTKPKDAKEAFQMLSELSNIWHEVYTGVCIRCGDKVFSDAEETKIQFHALNEQQIKKYHNAFYFSDKAAGYAIQKAGSIIIKKMIGCYYNVMGLPVGTLRSLLLKAGIDLWDYLKPL